jgi:hypothetical protein
MSDEAPGALIRLSASLAGRHVIDAEPGESVVANAS